MPRWMKVWNTFPKWLVGRWKETPPPNKEGGDEHHFELYPESERWIFHYSDGRNVVKCDPMVLYKRMMEKWVDLRNDLKIADSPSKAATEAHTKAVEKVRWIFGVKPYEVLPNGETFGLTEVETLDLLYTFREFVGVVKKNTSPPQTSSGGTSPTSSPSSGGNPPSESTSDSGSTGRGSGTDSPAPSPTESPSP